MRVTIQTAKSCLSWPQDHSPNRPGRSILLRILLRAPPAAKPPAESCGDHFASRLLAALGENPA